MHWLESCIEIRGVTKEGSGRLNVVKTLFHSKLIKAKPVKTPAGCFVDSDKLNLKHQCKGKELEYPSHLETNKTGDLTLHNFKTILSPVN